MMASLLVDDPDQPGGSNDGQLAGRQPFAA